MAVIHVCDVHGGVVEENQLRRVVVTRATLTGVKTQVGNATDEKIEAEVCEDCWTGVRALLAPFVSVPGAGDMVAKAAATASADDYLARIEEDSTLPKAA